MYIYIYIIYIYIIYIYDVVLCLVVYGFQRFEDAPGTLAFDHPSVLCTGAAETTSCGSLVIGLPSVTRVP